jgi:hypothetical protein
MTRLVASLVFVATLVGAAARAEDEAREEIACPLDGERFEVPLTVSANEGGGRDSDGCRWSIDPDGRLEVLELHDLVSCPKCGAALYRGNLEAAARLHRRADEAAIASALASAPPIDRSRIETTVAHALATYRVLGPAELGLTDGMDALEGRLWLRAAWAVRMRLVRDDEGPPLPVLFAPRNALDAVQKLATLELQAVPAGPGPNPATPVEDALGSLDQARTVLDPLDQDAKPSRRLAFERARSALDLIEQTLLILRGNLRTDRESDLSGRAAREFALAVARAAHRSGDGVRREQWLGEATQGDAPNDIVQEAARLRSWSQEESAYLGRAAEALARGAENAPPERRAVLLALAADATRRRISDPDSDLVRDARTLAQRAAAGTGAGARHATFLLERLGH